MGLFGKKKQPQGKGGGRAPLHTFPRYSGSGVCDVCNRPIGPGEAFQVPTPVFWGSSKYKNWIATNPVTRGMLNLWGATVDEYIARQRRMDQTAYSAVCSNCIHLFQ